MSSVSSFVFLSSNNDERELSDFSFIETQFTSQPSVAHSNDHDFEHLEHTNIDTKTPTAEWSAVNDYNFDIESIVPSHHSTDTVHRFIFSHYEFSKPATNHTNQSQWVWTNTLRRKRKCKPRRRHRNNLQTSLCIIDENGQIHSDSEPTVLNVANLNEFMADSISINNDISSVIRLCNQITNNGILSAHHNNYDIDIDLHQMPLIGLKLRDISMSKLVLLRDQKNITRADKYALRREYWLELSWSSRMYLTPFGSFEEFRDLYGVHPSVKSNELLSVMDLESFNILMKPEWIRVTLFRSYISRIQHLEHVQSCQERRDRQLHEMKSLVHVGCFNDDLVNIKRFKDEQLSIITSFRNESMSHFAESFDALEREIGKQMRIETELAERFTNTTYDP